MPTSKPIKPENQQVYESALPIGTVLRNGENEYTIEQVLGAGGFGITYRVSAVIMAHNVPITTNFAVKEFFMKGGERADDGTTVRYTKTMRQMAEESMNDFMVEARRLNTLSGKSRNIVRVNEVFKENNTAYYVMQYLDGGELTEHLEREGAMTEAQAIAVIRPIAEAVILIHREHLLHLDIKPENIVLMTSPRDRSQYPVLIDFGIAKHFTASGKPTSTHSAKGASDGYAPIEQYSSIDRFAPELDVYALGATLFSLLTGKIPKKAFDITETDILEALPENVSKRTRMAIVNAMKKLKEQRTPDIKTFLESLEDEYALPVGTVLTSPSLEYRITGLREERPGHIVYNAVMNTKEAKTDVDDNAASDGGSSRTKVMTRKMNSRSKATDSAQTAFIIFEAFNKQSCKRADDGAVISTDSERLRTARVDGDLATYRGKIGQTSEQGLPLAEQFTLNNTTYLAALIVKKAPLSERMAKNLSNAGSAIASSTSAFARKAMKPALYTVLTIAIGAGAYLGIKAIASGDNQDSEKTEQVKPAEPSPSETPEAESSQEEASNANKTETAQSDIKEETPAQTVNTDKEEANSQAQAAAAKTKADAEAKRKADAAAKAQADAEAKRKADAAAKVQADAEAKRKSDAAAKAQAEAEAKRKADAAAKAQAEAEAKRKAEAAAKAKAEEEAKRQAAKEKKRKENEAAAAALELELGL